MSGLMLKISFASVTRIVQYISSGHTCMHSCQVDLHRSKMAAFCREWSHRRRMCGGRDGDENVGIAYTYVEVDHRHIQTSTLPATHASPLPAAPEMPMHFSMHVLGRPG